MRSNNLYMKSTQTCTCSHMPHILYSFLSLPSTTIFERFENSRSLNVLELVEKKWNPKPVRGRLKPTLFALAVCIHASEPTMRDNSVDDTSINGPFLHSGHTYPLPCLPQPHPPKINVVFWTLKSFFYFRQHWFGGVRGFITFKRNEIINEWNCW